MHTLEYGVDFRENTQNFRTQITKTMEDYIATILLVELDLKLRVVVVLYKIILEGS